jgi:radical SAM protein with 4Fe4S-binding SPASM domain
MSLESFESILKKVYKYTNNIYLHIKGEPLMHPDIDNIIKLSNKYKLNINITTNGRLIKDKIDIININKIRQINISLHSYDSLDDIEYLLNTIDNIKNTYISFRLWNNKDNTNIINLLNEHYNTKIELNSKRITIKDNIFLSLDKLFTWPNMDIDVISNCGTCLGLRSQMGILVDGTVVPCCLDQDGDINLGNIFNEELDDILNKDKCKEIIEGFRNKKLIEPLCKRCGYIDRFMHNNVK